MDLATLKEQDLIFLFSNFLKFVVANPHNYVERIREKFQIGLGNLNLEKRPLFYNKIPL